MNAPQFDHEKLNVYHASLTFVGLATDLLEPAPKNAAVHNEEQGSYHPQSPGEQEQVKEPA